MSAFMKLGDVKGEATDNGHKEWIIINSMTSPIYRSIPPGAKDMERMRGDMIFADVVVERQVDKSITGLLFACASGDILEEVTIHFCTTVKNRQEPYFSFGLRHVIVTGVTFVGQASGDPLPHEQVTMNFTEAVWRYIIVDPETGDIKGSLVKEYSLGEGRGR